MDVNALQLWNALIPILVTESGSVMDVNEVQPENALVPILVTEFDSITLFKRVGDGTVIAGIEGVIVV
jgi:hypothetical protein